MRVVGRLDALGGVEGDKGNGRMVRHVDRSRGRPIVDARVKE